ncbi:sushi domain-containing protein 1 isoform X9 [Erpetoichthys calabaricus]|uniref:sushi domain-containing protein 1 isoform X9 n=1 Tax=Erpetoichthys calabaricus TaxID=27687 RepID=UPI00109EFA65|nr:sushi domain-containing protein 1 isoform X9 [Erpetoichthys calabaricus]
MNGVPELPRSAGAATAVLLLLASLQVQKVQMLITTPPDICATCHENATCSEKEDGSGKICICMYGLIGNGRTYCQDKDECKISSLICGEHTVCHNTYGSFYCTCLDGYRPSSNTELFIPNDGTHCEDINECDNQEICGDGGFCHNFNGSYNCTCQEGYSVQNGSEPFIRHVGGPYCRAVDCGMLPIVKDAVAPVASTTTYKSAVRYTCQKGTVWKSGNNTAICMATGMWGGPTLVCKEMDCGPPPVVSHASAIWDGSTRLGSVVFYECKEGFRHVGERNFTVCTVDGDWENISLVCEEIYCKVPHLIQNANLLWDGSRHPGSLASYQCKEGFYFKGSKNFSICNLRGIWDSISGECKEIDCGPPPSLPNITPLWNDTLDLRYGAVVYYRCTEGFYHAGGDNFSMCAANGLWQMTSLLCKEINCGKPASIPHATVLWNQASQLGSKVYYKCQDGFFTHSKNNYSMCAADGKWGQLNFTCIEIDCGIAPSLANAAMTASNGTVLGSVAHYQCNEGFINMGGTNVSICTGQGKWLLATLICDGIKEASPVISDLVIFDEKCIKWNAQRDRRANETYKLHLKGLRVYQEGFLEEIVTNFTSSEDSPELCLNLHPGTNYSLHITALSTGISTQAFLSTEIGDPGVPEIVFPIAEDPLPSFTFRKMADINGPISLYQVIVASQDRSLDFDCGSHNIPNFYSQDENEQIYLAAEFHAEDLSEEVVFLIGDRRFFGEYYNAPLDKSRAYVIILRVISEWKQVQKQSCVFWVQTKGPSYTTQHITILAVGSGVLVAFFVFLGNSFVWYCGKKYPCG